MTRPILLAVTGQLADLATFGMAVRAKGIGGEIGPLSALYVAGGFGAVALAKLVALALLLGILAAYSRCTGSSRRVALLVATVGVLGAIANTLAVL